MDDWKQANSKLASSIQAWQQGPLQAWLLLSFAYMSVCLFCLSAI